MLFSGILIGSEDPKGLTQYYTKLFGEPEWTDDAYTGWKFETGYVMIGAHDEVMGKSVHPGRVIWNLETPDVKGEFDRLKAAGAIVVQEPYDPTGGTSDMLIATFADPDDNYFQVMSPM